MGLNINSRETFAPSAPTAGFATLYPFGASDAVVNYFFKRPDGTVLTLAVLEGTIDNETPTGLITGTDGTDGNAVFTLAYAPAPAGSLQQFKTDLGTGVLMIAGIHYNLSGLTITYTAGNIPITGQTHRAWYRK